MDELYYEGWDAIERAWREGLTPDPLLTVSEWADKHRVLSRKAASEPAESLGCRPGGQVMPMAGSFQAMQRSCWGA